MTCTVCHLLSFGEVFIHISIQLELTHISDWNKLFRPDFCCIENIEVELMLITLRYELDAELPVGKGTIVDSFVEILAMEIRILTSQLQCFVPNKRVNAKFWCEDEFDECALAFRINERVCIDSEPLHHAVGSRDASV